LSIEPKLPAELDWYRDVMKQILCADATLCAAHTSLDVQFGGVVSWFGRELGLRGLRVLDPVAENDSGETLGYGCIGDLEYAMSFEVFVEQVAQSIGCEVLTLCGPAPETVSRVAMCPGSGSSLMDKAFVQGADVFITGDVKYHPAQESVGAVLDVGHFSLEEEMMRRFSVVLEQELEDGVEVRFFNGRNPFVYHLQGKGVLKSRAGLL
jgi:putative NIF3 family GTP cyclohydrolase 1 type 2